MQNSSQFYDNPKTLPDAFAGRREFHNDVLRGLLRANPALDIVRVQDTEIYQAADPIVLEWAANENRVLLTHDVQTMTKYANQRVLATEYMPGVLEVDTDAPIGQVIEEILVVLGASYPHELENRIIFIPLT